MKLKDMINFIIKSVQNDIVTIYPVLMLCLFAAATPFIGVFLPWGAVQGAMTGSALACLLLSVACSFDKLNTRQFLCFAAAALMSVFAVVRSNFSLISITLYVAVLLLCPLAMKNKNFHKYADLLLNIFLAFCLIYAVVTVLSFFSRSFYVNHIASFFPKRRADLIVRYDEGCIAGFTSNYSTNGTYLAIGLLISAAKFNINKNKKNILMIVLFLVSILMTGKRAHILFGVAALYVLYFFSQTDKNQILKCLKTLGIVLATLCVVVIVFMFVPSLTTVLQRFMDPGDDVSSGRFELWELAFDAFKQSPVIGIGWRHYMTDVGILFATEYPYDTHNVFIQLLCEIGIIGAPVYYVWFIVFYVMTVKTYRKSLSANTVISPWCKYLLGFSLVYQTFFFMYCVTGNPLYETYTFIPYFISCAITLYCKYNKSAKIPDIKQLMHK